MVIRHRETHLRLGGIHHDGALESTQTQHIIEFPRPLMDWVDTHTPGAGQGSLCPDNN